MVKIRKRIKGIIAMTLVVTTIITGSSTAKIANAATIDSSGIAVEQVSYVNDYDLADTIGDGTILHAWDWSFNSIKDNLEDIAKAGYTSVQVSPIQPNKNDDYKENTKWWILYQPIDFKIGNAQLGTKDEFAAMCNEADKYGIKIIVDIVANHTGNNEGDGNTTIAPQVKFQGSGYEDYWHNPLHGVKDWDDRYEVTHGGIGLPDLNTGNEKVQKMVKDYLQECLDSGADGFRFDAAKHIELPTDDSETKSNFWTNVLNGLETTDGKDPYVYGEVLQGGADKYSEYSEVMHVTTSNYGNDIRKAVGFGTDANVSNVKDYDVPAGIDPSRLVTWVESHDTYANDSEESTGLTDEQIKNGWAIIASRADSTPLYFNRTAGRKKLQGNIGDPGNDNWKDPDVVAVNKFHNAMIGQEEILNKVSKEIMMIERGTKGVTIVNLGNDIEINHSTKLADGTYTNCATTGGVFTVKDGIITGNLSKGITVLYEGGVTEAPVTTPKVSISKEDCSFEGSLDIVLNAINAEKATYSINGGAEESYIDGQTLRIGENAEVGDKIKVLVKATNGDRKAVEEYTYIKKDSKSIATIYFKKPAGWQIPYVYIYNELGENEGKWPGVKMTKIDENLYKYELKGFTDAKVMFNDWFYGGNKSEELDLSATGKMIYDSSAADKWAKTEDIATNPDVEEDKEEKSTAKVYFQKPEEWTTDDINIYFYKTGASGPSWPGVPMEKVDGKEGLYTYTLPKGLEGAMVLFNTKNGSVQVPKDTGFKAPADTTMIYDNGWKEYTNGISKVYFRKPADWKEPNIYAWKDSKKNAEWPGVKMEKVKGTETLYSYTLPENFGDANVIFNDKTAGSDDGNQTKDLILPFETSKIYDEKTETLRDFTVDDLKEPEKEVEPGEVKGVTKIYFKNTSGWANVNAYAYNDGTADKVKEWPGVKATDEGEGLFSYTLPKGFEGATVIFNNGDGKQTGNLKTKIGHTMIYDADSDSLTSMSKIYFKNTEGWDKVKVHYWVEGGASTDWPGVSMVNEGDNLYSYTLPEGFQNVNVIFNNNSNGKQTKIVKISDGETLIFVPSCEGADNNREGEWRAFEAKDIPSSTENPDPEEPTDPGEDKEVGSTVYVKVPEGWSGVPNIHYWNTAGGTTNWPGKPMKDEGNGVFSYEIPKSFGDVTVIINDGNNKLTDNEGKDEFAVNLGSSIIFEDGAWKDYVKPTPDPGDEKSKTPTVSGSIYTTTTTVTGTAGANADIILTVDEEIKTTTSVGAKVEVISTINKKEIGSTKADEQGKWSAEISRQSKGTVITVTATEEDKLPASSNVTVRKKSSSSSSSSSSSNNSNSNSSSNNSNNSNNSGSNTDVPDNKKTGWEQLSNGQWNYIESGKISTGWRHLNEKWYFMNEVGIMQIGWINPNGTWYYLNSNGEMLTGWKYVGQSWYYLQSNGAMKTGWLNDNGIWYYLNSNGDMAIGWQYIGDSWYYLESTGAMAYNTIIGGYKLGPSGAWIK